jgi:hypothetical protein
VPFRRGSFVATPKNIAIPTWLSPRQPWCITDRPRSSSSAVKQFSIRLFTLTRNGSSGKRQNHPRFRQRPGSTNDQT